jgi:collagen type III alpha
VLDVLDDRDQIGSRPNVGGYGVTAPGAYPDLEQPFVSITDGSEASEAPNPAAAASGPGPAAGGDPLRRVAAGDASAVVAAARAASAEAAAAASADAAYARGKAARLAAAKAAPRVAFGGRPPPKRASPPRRAGAGRRAGVPAAATRRSRRLRVLRAANADSDSDSSSDGSSDGNADGKENVGAKHDTMAFGAGPAFSFGARTSPVPGASLWWGPGAGPDASPGPGAYGDPESRLARHVPAVTFGKPRDGTGEGAGVDRSPTKPPSAKKSRGVWDPLGGVDPDAPGPGHYYDPARSPSRVGASGPKFSFGGGKDDIGKLRAPGPHDTPGPGAYHDSAAAARRARRRGLPVPRSSRSGVA